MSTIPPSAGGSNNQRAVEWLLVILQMAMLAALVLLPAHSAVNATLTIIGRLLILLAIVLVIFARVSMAKHTFSVLPSPRIDSQLCVTGPYRYIRHPMYTAVLLAGFGLCLMHLTLLHWLALAVLTVVMLLKLKLEETLLLARHGDNYANYRAETHALLPLIL